MSDSTRGQWIAMLRDLEGAEYWRALSGLMEIEEFRAEAHRLLPALGEVAESAAKSGVGRRDFLKLAGASLALTGLTACLQEPPREILPYTIQPPELIPGNPLYYATTMELAGFGTGLLVESREGRPTKIEGNPDHPASLGAAGLYEQASVLELYDPNRARHTWYRGRVRTFLDFTRAFAPTSRTVLGAPTTGEGLHFLLEPTASPLTGELVARVREAYPAARFTFYSPLVTDYELEGTRLALGRRLQPIYDLREADVLVSLDAGLLDSGPFHLRHAREFADRRRLKGPDSRMSRFYLAESSYTPTGVLADERLAVRSTKIGDLALAILEGVDSATPPGEGRTTPFDDHPWVRSVVEDLRRAPGRSLIVAGERQPPAVHAIAHALNLSLGNVGRTVSYIDPLLIGEELATDTPETLIEALGAGAVEYLVIVGGNPVYDLPVDYHFGELLSQVPASVYCGLYRNETGRLADWMVPGLHYLESWGDARAWDGTASLIQPLINPLYGGMTVDDILKLFLWEAADDAHSLLWHSWQERLGLGSEFESFWAHALQRGVIPESGPSPTPPEPIGLGSRPDPAMLAELVGEGGGGDGLVLSLRGDPKVYDGRFADNGWLQELPEPITKQSWGNAALLSPSTARELRLESGDLVELDLRGVRIEAPVLVVPGQADGEVTLSLGYGRSGEESVARGVGTNAYLLHFSDSPWFVPGLTLTRKGRAGGRDRLAITQENWSQEGRPIALSATLAEYQANPGFTSEERGPLPTLYDTWEYEGEQWAMTIDLTLCTGCSACVIACQAENNSPVVGKEGVLRHREMHWLRIDRYLVGDDNGEARLVMQPMMCQHCEMAPCEYVCPVNATVHSSDGLNEMIYNRCVGTRFCSNNCPYKVRRFNWFDYSALRSPTEDLQLNPDVTVRARGVMEKCTYCVQRIRRVGIRARIEGRDPRDGEVQTACQQTCPTRAIIFGSLGDPESQVSISRSEPRIYSVLHEQGTRPRTQYLAKITNPAPATREG